MQDAATTETPFRYYGLDLIRLVSFIAIAFFHISLIHYYELDVPLSEESIIAVWIEMYARSISFSGFTIVLLSSFLTGFSSGSLSHRLRLFGVLSVAWIVLSSLMTPNYVSFLAWDIYPLYIVGIIFCTVSEIKLKPLITVAALTGFIMLWIPFWEYAHRIEMNNTLRNVLGFADCSQEIAEWPILPWIGLVFIGYGGGYWLRHLGRKTGLPMTRIEWVAFPILLVLSLPYWGPFYEIQLGDQFSCEVYRMPPLIFWSHLIWVIFFMRLSVDPRINNWLSRFALARWISDLAISKKFWAAYLLNYCLAHVLSFLADRLGVTGSVLEPEIITWFALIFLPLTELATRGVLVTMSIAEQRLAKRAQP
jgi:hypothetical protein